MFSTKLAVVALLLTVCYFAYVCCEDKRFEKAKKIFDAYDDNKEHRNATDWWYREQGICTSDEFKDEKNEIDDKPYEIKCDGTPNKVVCIVKAMGYLRKRTYRCCKGLANIKGDGCKPKPKPEEEE